MSTFPIEFEKNMESQRPPCIKYDNLSQLFTAPDQIADKILFCSPINLKKGENKTNFMDKQECSTNQNQTRSTNCTSGRMQSGLNTNQVKREDSSCRGRPNVSSFMMNDKIISKPKCNWEIYGSYLFQEKKLDLIDKATNLVFLEQPSHNLQRQHNTKPLRMLKPRQFSQLSLDEQREISMLRKLANKESSKQLTLTSMNKFQDYLQRRQELQESSLSKMFKKPLLPNGHLYCAGTRQIQKIQSHPKVLVQAQQSICQISKRIKKQKMKRPNFDLTKRHKLLLKLAQVLQTQEDRRDHQKMKKKALFKLRCFSKKRHPVAISLRLLKFSLNQQKEDEKEEAKKVSEFQGPSLESLLLNENHINQEIKNESTEPPFEFQVLEDINAFKDLIHFFFERRTIICEKAFGQWIDYYEPRNAGVIPKLEEIQRICFESVADLLFMKKQLRALGDQIVIDKLVKYCSSLTRLFNNVKMSAPRTILGHYIGDRLIDVKGISKFNILMNENIYAIKLLPRKQREKDWAKEIERYKLQLEKLKVRKSKIELLCARFKIFENKNSFKKCLFFLRLVEDKDQLLDACLSITGKQYQIQSTIRVPSIKDHQAHIAFQKIMRIDDLSKFMISGKFSDIYIKVPKESLREFAIKLDELKLNRKDSMWVSDDKITNKRENKAQAKEEINLEWFDYEQAYPYSFSLLNQPGIQEHQSPVCQKKAQEQDQIVITKYLKIAPRQSSIDYLAFNDEDN